MGDQGTLYVTFLRDTAIYLGEFFHSSTRHRQQVRVNKTSAECSEQGGQ
jgi:hypothetical protein